MKSSVVSGVVFQFNTFSALFEFKDAAKEEEAIGVVKLCDLYKGDKSVSELMGEPSESAVAQYLSIGNELECEVERRDDLDEFVYTEEEEEIDESGQLNFTSRQVAIKPLFKANKATLKPENSSNSKDTSAKEMEEYEDVLEITVIEPKRKRVEEVDLADDDKEAKKDALITCRAKLVQLKRPQNPHGMSKVSSGIMEVIEGRYEGHRALFHSHNLYLFGHHLKEADLLYGLRAGDEFEVDCNDQSGDEETLLIKKAFLMVGNSESSRKKSYRDDKPVRASDDAAFASWLASRNLDYSSFQRWLSGQLPRKPYFPLQSELFQGALVTLMRMEQCTGEGGIIRINDDQWPMDNKLVVFDRNSLYIQGVSAGQTDLRLLLRPGDKFSCQVEEMSSSERRHYKRKLKSYISEGEECNHVAYLAFVGDRRPKSATLSPKESPELKTYLDAVGLTTEEFEEMQRGGPKSSAKQNRTTLTTNDTTFALPPNFFEDSRNPLLKDGKALNTSETITVPVVSALQPVNSLMARLMTLKTANDAEVKNLLMSYEDAHNAIFIAKTCTAALVFAMQNVIFDKWNGSKQTEQQLAPLSLKDTVMKLEASNSFFSKEQQKQGPLPLGKQTNKPNTQAKTTKTSTSTRSKSVEKPEDLRSKLEMMQKTIESYDSSTNISKQFTDLETRMQNQQRQQRTGSEGRGRAGTKESNKARQMLQSYVESSRLKSKDTNQNVSNSKEVLDDGQGALHHLRNFVSNSRLPYQVHNVIQFDTAKYSSHITTNFRVHNVGNDRPQYYRLGTLVHFLRNERLKHEDYERIARESGHETVKKQDRANLLAYLKSEASYVPNIDPDVNSDVTDRRAVEKIKRHQKRTFEDRERKGRSQPPQSRGYDPTSRMNTEAAPVCSHQSGSRPTFDHSRKSPNVANQERNSRFVVEQSSIPSTLPVPVQSVRHVPAAPVISGRRESRSPSVEMIVEDVQDEPVRQSGPVQQRKQLPQQQQQLRLPQQQQQQQLRLPQQQQQQQLRLPQQQPQQLRLQQQQQQLRLPQQQQQQQQRQQLHLPQQQQHLQQQLLQQQPLHLPQQQQQQQHPQQKEQQPAKQPAVQGFASSFSAGSGFW